MLAHALLIASLLAAEDEPRAPAPPAAETTSPSPAAQPPTPPVLPRWHLAVETHASLLNGSSGSPNLSVAFGFGLRGGVEFGRWGLFLHVENDLWAVTTYGNTLTPGVLNYGVGGDFRYADGFVRTALTLGLSTLLFNTPIDTAGSTGLFLHAVPVGLRWKLSPRLTLGLDPIAFVLEMPVMTRIPLARMQYRAALSLEFGP